jgi:cysteine desulfurase/selenocysteine lyase
MGIDVLAFTGHKSLLAPTGIGGLLVRDGVSIRPTRFGGTGVDSVNPYQPEEYPNRLEAGTSNLLGIAGLHFAQGYIAKRGMVNIFRHEMELFAALQAGLGEIEGVTLLGTTSLESRLPVLSFNLAGRDPAEVGALLGANYGIATRTGLHCAPLIHRQMGTGERGTVRLSVGPMSAASDVEAAVTAVAEIAAQARK